MPHEKVAVTTDTRDLEDMSPEAAEAILSNCNMKLHLDMPPMVETIEEARELLFADHQRVIVQGSSLRCWISQGVWDSQDQGMVATRVAIAELSEAVFDELSEDPRLTQCRCSQFFQRAADSNVVPN